MYYRFYMIYKINYLNPFFSVFTLLALIKKHNIQVHNVDIPVCIDKGKLY